MTRTKSLIFVAALVWGGCSGDDGKTTLINVAPEAAGENCAEGGSAIQTGADDNGNGTLDTGEVDQTTYLCDASVVLSTEEEPPGDNCAAGGTAIHSGTDDNANGTLDDAEIDDTAYSCNVIGGVLEGHARVNSAIDVAVLNAYTEVTGHLYIEANMELVELDSLQHVGRDIYVRAPTSGKVSMPALETVGTGLFVEDCNITEFSAPLVNVTAGDVWFDNVPELTSLDLSALDSVNDGGILHVSQAAKLASLSLPSLVSTGDVEIDNNDALTTLSMPLLTTVDGDLTIVSNDSLLCAVVTAIEAQLTTLTGTATNSGNADC